MSPILIGATNPGLGLPAYNGGPTQTIALLAGSPALGAGSNALAVDPTTELPLTYDQRGQGFPRIVNGTVDIGAFERPLAASIGPATVYTVDLTSDTGASTGSDAGDLAYVIGQANLNPNLAGSVICFDPTVFSASSPKTILLTSTLELGEPSGPTVIDGPGAGVVTISGGGTVGVFQVEPGAVTTLLGLTISGGSATNGGGIDVANGGTMTVIDCTITANTAGSEGGGIASAGMLTVIDSTIEGNSTTGYFSYGGGIYSVGTLTVTGSTIAGNSTTTNGAGIFTAGSATVSGSTIQDNTLTGNPYGGGGAGISSFGVLTVNDCAITDNTADGSGGGGIENGGGTTTVTDCTIAGNSASGGAGGIANGGTMTITGSTIENNTIGVYAGGGGIANSGTLTLSDCAVEGNSVPMNTNGSGGGIWNSGTLTVAECTISDNSAGLGGGIYSEGTCAVTDTSIAGNSAIYGGGIECSGTTAITGSMISGNTVLYGGGGIYNGGALMVTDCAITDNSAIYGGGGIVNDGTLTVTNSSIADNQCGYIPIPNPPGGGGILNYGTLTAVNTTIADNTAFGYGGGVYDYPGSTTTLYNTIVAVNATTIDGADDIAGAVVSSASAFNLVGVDETGSLTSGNNGNQVGVADPGLASGLANNGGTTDTIALLAGSPAIDAGSNALAVDANGNALTTDQRGPGFQRIVNGTVDIGAFEFQTGPLATTSTTISPLANPPLYGQSVTFTATVAPNTGSGTPCGTVQFLIDGTDFGSPVPLEGGSATSEAISSLSVASHTIQADYLGAGNFGASDGTLTQAVSQDSTTTSFVPSATTSDPGQTVTFTASVAANAPSLATPAGTVQFLIDGSDFGSPVTLVNGSATSGGISSLSAASHTIEAVYSGGTDFATSTGTLTETVAQQGTTTSVVSSAGSSSLGQSVTFTANVATNVPGSGTPAGTVQFLIDGSDFGGPVTLVNGSASSAGISTLSAASHTIEAVYSGATDFAGSTGTLTQTVSPGSAPPAPGSVPPTGSVSYYVGAVNPSDLIGTGTLSTNSNGMTTATFSTHSLPAGTYAITAVYGGDANYPGSTSNVVSQTVNPAPLSITAGNQTKVYGQANPALTVSYSGFVNGDTSANLTTLPTVMTTATTTSPAGSYPITASGAVDPNYTISYVAGMLTISQDATTTAISSSTTSTGFGQSVTLSATVTANSPGSGTPTGRVDFFDTTTGDDLGSVALSGGKAALSTASLPVGGNTIKATYSGDGNFLTSSATAGAITINQSIIVLDPTAGGALSLSGNASIKLAGGVFVDSSSSTAISASGNAAVKASVIDVHGGVQKSGNASFSPAPTTGAART